MYLVSIFTKSLQWKRKYFSMRPD